MTEWLRLEGPPEVSWSNPLLKKGHLESGAQRHVQMASGYIQGWTPHKFFGSMSALYWGAQNWTQHSRCGLTSVEQEGRIISLDLQQFSSCSPGHIAGLCSTWVSTRNPRSSSAKISLKV